MGAGSNRLRRHRHMGARWSPRRRTQTGRKVQSRSPTWGHEGGQARPFGIEDRRREEAKGTSLIRCSGPTRLQSSLEVDSRSRGGGKKKKIVGRSAAPTPGQLPVAGVRLHSDADQVGWPAEASGFPRKKQERALAGPRSESRDTPEATLDPVPRGSVHAARLALISDANSSSRSSGRS